MSGKISSIGVCALLLCVFIILGGCASADTTTDPSITDPAIPAAEADAPPTGAGAPSAVPAEPPATNIAPVPEEADASASISSSGSTEDEPPPEEAEPQPEIITITISAAGDTTLGGSINGTHMFLREFELSGRDHGHFLRNVKHIFDEDDLTILNLEGTLTDSASHVNKTFPLRGPPHFAKILSSSGVDVVTLANNHTYDFYERGYRDTIANLEAEGIAYFGNEYNTILEIKGIRVGLFGLVIWSDGRNYRSFISAAVDDLKERGAELIIAYYHWGTERSNTPFTLHRTLGRFSIDYGVDLVLGAHPHVLQGIEEYKGKNIVYSLANFSFGANNNPDDHDTMIFQQTFTFIDGELQDINESNIIPVLISSVRNRNNFQPIVAEGADAERILRRMQEYSDILQNSEP